MACIPAPMRPERGSYPSSLAYHNALRRHGRDVRARHAQARRDEIVLHVLAGVSVAAVALLVLAVVVG